MKNIGMLFVCVLAAAACGGSKQSAQPTTPDSNANPDTTAASLEAPPAEPAAQEPAPPPEPEPAPPPPPPPSIIATAELKAVKDDASMGTITFELKPDTKVVVINGTFTGLKKKGVHAFYVHEKGDCSGKGKKIGLHLNPTKAKHGPPASAERHAGDFGDLTADDTGAATFTMETDSITVEADRPDSVLNRAIVIHANKDDKKGSGGPALACGVIQLKTE